MSKLVFCSNCGKRLEVYRKAIPTHSMIINLVTPHECTEEPIEFDITPLKVPTIQPDEKENKFVKKLNGLSPSHLPNIDLDLRDRRPSDQVKSTAPKSLLSSIKGIQNTQPVNDTSDEPG